MVSQNLGKDEQLVAVILRGACDENLSGSMETIKELMERLGCEKTRENRQ